MSEYIERETLRSDFLACNKNSSKWTPQRVNALIYRQPTAADVAPVVHGRWIEGFDEIKCSVCRREWSYCDNDTNTFNYCPNCGAMMAGSESNG